MKIRLICIIVFLSLGVMSLTHAQSYRRLWKQVEQAEQKSLPETIVRLTGEIYKKAKTEKNSPQMFKAYLWQMRFKEKIAPDSFYVSLDGLEQWARTTDKPLDRAVLHSLIGSFYTDYALGNRRKLSRRTELEEVTSSSDIREWSKNQFVTKVMSEITQVFQDSLLLLATSSIDYTPLVELGVTSDYYYHDMYHLLASRAIASLKDLSGLGSESLINMRIDGIYKQMINLYHQTDKLNALLLTNLDYLQWKRRIAPDYRHHSVSEGIDGLKRDPYWMALDKLIKENQSRDICAEAYLLQAQEAVKAEIPALGLQLCNEAISRYPTYYRINALKQLKQTILKPDFTVETPSSVYPGEEFDLNVDFKNLKSFAVHLYAINLPVPFSTEEEPDEAFLKKHGHLLSSAHYNLLPSDYKRQDSLFHFKVPEVGLYVLRIVPDDDACSYSAKFLYSTRFKVLTRFLPFRQREVAVLDNMSGKPVEGALLSVFDKQNKLLQTATTNAEGKAQFASSLEYRSLTVSKGADTAFSPIDFWGGYYNFTDHTNLVSSVTLLTDRSLYRPGQTVYVKGIAYEQYPDSAHVLVGREYTLTLTDTNGQVVGTKKLRTNDFGSFTTEFVLPSVCLNGSFRLHTQNGFRTIRVEEYKRPTFDITFEPLREGYRLGDRIELKGKVKTFSGVPLQNIPVTYTLTRSLCSWRMWGVNPVILVSDTVRLGENGVFELPLDLKPETSRSGFDENNSFSSPYYYNYKVQVSVTSVAGETQTSEISLRAGNTSLQLYADINGIICKDDSIKAVFKVNNLDRKPVVVEGNYQLFFIPDYEEFKAVKDQNVSAQAVLSGSFSSNEEQNLSNWKTLPSGAYKLVASVTDAQGNKAETEKIVVLFASEDKHPPVSMPLWFYESNTQFDALHPARFYFGTSEKDAYVFMDVFCDNKRLESKLLHLSDSIVYFEYPYRESYGNGLGITFAFVRKGLLYKQEVTLTKRLPDNTLNMRWDVFRDKLLPGQEEEWKLTIRNSQDSPALAEMLATMYDASLDKIVKTVQPWQLNYRLFVPISQWSTDYEDSNNFYFKFPQCDLMVPSFSYDQFLFPSIGHDQAELMSLFGNDVSSTRYFSSYVNKSNKGQSKADDEADSNITLRTNFAETAFFYPQLHTNAQGEVCFSFRMPQSLTTWNFRGYAHTQNMMMGQIKATAVTEKKFMLTPNLPRFVRVGDHTTLAASVSNQTGTGVSGTVKLVLFNPKTDQVISTQQKMFRAEPGQTVGVDFLFVVTGKYDVLGCRMIAEGGNFSDGEQHLLPVLSNKKNLTETLPMPVRGEQTHTFSLADLFNHHSKTATNRRLTVEFTSNPAWYAVQALPALSQTENENAISWATSWYANTMASYIMNAQPRIRSIFDSWKLKGGSKETFLSNLQKNQEVKNILLSESPWVMEATTESEQKERIATLFDLNNIRYNNAAALLKLQELQLPDGSWSWYKGMNGSLFVTDFIVEQNARIALLTGKPLEGAALNMQRSAFGYLHKRAMKEYRYMRKAEKESGKSQQISRSILKYLYLMAISNEKVPASMKDVHTYFLSKVASLLPSQSISEKAWSAIILQKAGKAKEAHEIMASLKEYLTRTDDQGMFFDIADSPYSWNNLKVPAHVDVMEAFERVEGDAQIVEEMKIWLLKQKQVCQWNSPVATADAVYALLSNGADLLDNQGDVRIVLGNEIVETVTPSKTTVPGLGYIRKSFEDRKTVDATKILVEKRDPGIAWGAVYAQFEENLDQVVRQGNGLNVDKKLYVEKIVRDKRQLQPIMDKTQLKVGDKVVVRLIVRLDRTMDFVQLRDQRAACFEPIEFLSGYRNVGDAACYVAVKDASTDLFFDTLNKGTYVLEYSYRVDRAGSYETGVTTIQSAYAPEYAAHSASFRCNVVR